MLALWRLSMRFLLRTWHFRATDSFECFTMAMDFVCQNVGKVGSGSFSELQRKKTHSLRFKFTCRLTCMYSAASLPLQKCSSMCMHCVCAVGRFLPALKCRRWVGGGGEQWSGCKLRTDRCSVLSALYSWHSGSMGHFNTSTLYPHGTAGRAADLSRSFSLSLSSHLSLPFFLCLDRQMCLLLDFIRTAVLSLTLYSKTPVRKFFMAQQESSLLSTFSIYINHLILCETQTQYELCF